MRLDFTDKQQRKPFFTWFIPTDLVLKVCEKLIDLERQRIEAEQEDWGAEAATLAQTQGNILRAVKNAQLDELERYVSDND